MFGWDHVAQGIVQLGFYLMDTFGSKNNGTGMDYYDVESQEWVQLEIPVQWPL